MITPYQIFFLKNILVCIFKFTIFESLICLYVPILYYYRFNVSSVIMVTIFLCFNNNLRLFNFDIDVQKIRVN